MSVTTNKEIDYHTINNETIIEKKINKHTTHVQTTIHTKKRANSPVPKIISVIFIKQPQHLLRITSRISNPP